MYKDSGSPEKSSGTGLFYLYDKNYAMRMYSLFLPPGTGFDQSARSLAAFYNMPPPAAGQVVCWHQKLPLSEATAHRVTAWRAKVAKSTRKND